MSIVKFLVNTAIVGAIAGGVYYYLDQNARRNAADAEDPDEAPRTFDKENIKDAADRAYTTIAHGTEEAAATIKRTVGPQGEQILSDVQDAAGKVQETVTYAGKKVGGIVTDSDSTVQEKASAVADTFKYAAAELREKFRKGPIDVEAEEVETAEDEDDADVEVEFYVDEAAAQEAEAEDNQEEYNPDVEVFVEPTDSEEPAEAHVAEAAPADEAAETVAEPAADAAQIEEFFDEESN